jgi:archaetidylinositol phosphate synthase
MATPWIDYCEQGNPVVLKEVRVAKPAFESAKRVQQSMLAGVEKRALIWMAERTPAWVGSDTLTLIGFFGQVMAGVSYAMARYHRYWLVIGIGFLALNWFGDSLDGTLARVRQQQRPRYGFYVDHMIDSLGAVAMMGGLALSGYMHPYIAIGLLVVFLLLSIQSYLATYTMGEFHLSFFSFGPTELRILLMVGNLALLRWPIVLGHRYRLFDVGGAIGLVCMTLLLIVVTARNTYRLYHEERLR